MAETAVWSAVLLGVWTATLTTTNVVEAVVAVALAVPVAVLAVAARRTLDAAVRPRWSWSRWAVLVPGAVVADTARLAVALARALRHGRPLGAPRRLPLPDEAPDTARARAALGAVAISTTPGAYVTGAGDRSLAVHALSSRPTALERAVTR